MNLEAKECEIMDCAFVDENQLADIDERDLVIDSPIPDDENWGGVRIDHHVDDGWTMLDSLSRVDWRDVRKHDVRRVVSTYLDPDAMIGAAVALEALDDTSFSFNDSDVLKPFYLASFLSDYAGAWTELEDVWGTRGNRLDLWLRLEMEKPSMLGDEDRGERNEEYDQRRTSTMQKLVSELRKMWRQEDLSEDCYEMDARAEFEELQSVFSAYVSESLSTSDVGVFDAVDEDRRVIPRAYLPLFDQPVVVRVIRKSDGSSMQILVGINPTVDDWETLDLRLLAKQCSNVSEDIQMRGRRGVIGGRPDLPLADVIDVINQCDIDGCRNEPSYWSGFEWGPSVS